MYCDLWLQYIQVRKLFKGGNYSRAETIRGNTVCSLMPNLIKKCRTVSSAGGYRDLRFGPQIVLADRLLNPIQITGEGSRLHPSYRLVLNKF